jgi:hypothetical protein
MGILSSPLNTYKPPGSTFNLIRRHMFLKELVSWLKGGKSSNFLGKYAPEKKCTPKSGRNITAIARKLLILAEAIAEARVTHLIWYTQQKYLWESDKNLKEAAKRFVLPLFEPVYFQELVHGLTKFKIVTIEEIIAHIHLNYPAEPEEIELQEATLRLEWDPNNHIENVFQSVKVGVETLFQMDAITSNNNMGKKCVKYVYSAIWGSGQLESAFIKWKALPAADRATMRQI